MKEYIAFDCHKRYTLAEREEIATGRAVQTRIEHAPGAIRRYLADVEPGTPVAVEAIGHWYWIVDEIEEARCVPLLVHPRKAKLMMGLINKTDRLDVHGMNRLQRNGTLPTVWIPPAALRDLRELTRLRMVVSQSRTRLKNRILATLTKYALAVEEYSDAFGRRARQALEARAAQLPPHARRATGLMLAQVDLLGAQIAELEGLLKTQAGVTPEIERLMSLPGVGLVLATAIAFEAGDAARFASAGRLAAYAGTTPRVHASGGKVRMGPLRNDVNHTLKWAFSEAANSVAVNHRRRPDRHVSRLYAAIRRKKGHAVAVGAVARHLAEAAYCVMSRNETYRDPALAKARTSRA
jgi:transposase